MKKPNLQMKPMLKRVIVSACALSVMTSTAWAQNATPKSDDQTSGAASPFGTGSTVLPAIGNSRSSDFQNQNQNQNVLSPRTQQVKPQTTARKPGEFEKFVAGVINDGSVDATKLKIFGSELFDGVPTTFSPSTANQVNQDYLIGTGDELQIRGWGMVSIDVTVRVDRSGAIYIPRVGSVNVAGVKYRDLQGYLKQAVGRIFTNFDLTVSLSQVRSVQIYVVGNAVRPGTYTLSAMSTLLNALFTSGGPDTSGSMRNIEVKRGAQTVTRFDMYDMLLKGDKSHDIPLQDGDVVYIPEIGPLVALAGNVKQPAIFELKGRSAPLSDVVSWAGGFASSADSKEVVIERNVNNEYQTIATLVADQASSAANLAQIEVRPADVLRVFSPNSVAIEANVKTAYVRVSGAVRQSGVFKLNQGETLRALLTRLGGVNDDGYVFGTELKRESVRRLQQSRLDELAERFKRDLESGSAQTLASTTDSASLASLSATIDRQRSIAERMATVKSRGRIVLELEDGDAQVKNLPDIPLRDGDGVYVPVRPGTVDVLGAVFQQNSFIYRPSRQLSDYVRQAGGATQTADTSQMYIIRADGTAVSRSGRSWFSGIDSSKINPGDTIVVPEEIAHTSWTQSLREWTSIFYQFGLGAAGLKVLKD